MTIGASVDNTDTSQQQNINETQNTDSSQSTKDTASSSSDTIQNILTSITNWANSLQTSGSSSKQGGQTTSTGSTTQNQTTSSNTSSNVDNLINQTTSASASAINSAQRVYDSAINGADNYQNDTLNLVNNIVQKAAVGFGSTRALQTQSGLYNSSSNDLLTGYAVGQATSDAAATVLNYKTSEQSLADAAAGRLISATTTTTGDNKQIGNTSNLTNLTGTTNTSNNVGTTEFGQTNSATETGSSGGSTQSTNQNTGTNTNSISDIVTNLTSLIHKFGNDTTTGSSTSEKGGLSVSYVCTALNEIGELSDSERRKNFKGFINYPWWGIAGYHLWANTCATFIKANPKSLRAKFATIIFKRRAQGNWLANKIVELPSFFCGLFILLTGRK